MSDATTTVRPFSCGTQYADWTDSNCATCRKAVKDGEKAVIDGKTITCEIERALVDAYMDSGRIPLPIADRMGHHDGRYVWPCKEHDPPFVNVRTDGTVDPSVEKESAK